MKKIFFPILALCACAGSIGAAETVLLDETFASGQGDFSIVNVKLPSNTQNVWSYGSSYMKASAYISSTPYASESWLISPIFDMYGYSSATLKFDHAAKFQVGNFANEFQVFIAQNPSGIAMFDATEWTQLTIPTMPTAGSWDFVSSGEIDLTPYVGEKNVRIAFRYVSTTSAADTWEIKNVKVIAGEVISYKADIPKYEYGDLFYVHNKNGEVEGFSVAKVDSISFIEPTDNGYSLVDLDLPSGLLWATCNVGATKPEEYGNYYAWGETETKNTYDWNTYKYATAKWVEDESYDEGGYWQTDSLLKYNSNNSLGRVDNLAVLDLADDAATANWGGNWRIPTVDEWQELIDSCTWTWTNKKSVYGYKVASKKNSNFIFLPAAGFRENGEIYDTGSDGHCNYWTSSLYASKESGAQYVSSRSTEGASRYYGLTVRPVHSKCYRITIAESENGSVSVGRTFSLAGKTNKLTITPDSGYVLQSLSVMCGGNEVTATSGSFVMPAGDVEISASFSKVEPLAGIFSISADEVVKFAPGNLQYRQSTKTWSFAAKQYEVLGPDNAIGFRIISDSCGFVEYYPGDALADKIDLFGWSAYNTTAPWGISTSTTSDDYSGDFADWGENFDDGNTWRTLTKGEWKYVINTRNNASTLKGVARINLNEDGTKYANGLILLPDTWEDVSGITFKRGFSSDYSDDAYADFQTFTLPQWEKLESAGAVFLPAAGKRSGGTPPIDQRDGYYWSATASGSDAACYMHFISDSTYSSATSSTSRYFGYAVRLVKYNEEKPTYNISLAEIENGTVTLSTTAAKGGDEITFRITPNHGYILKSISVMRGEKEVAITDSSFVMPWGDVKISASFENITPGAFSIAVNKAVKFAPGNLQYQASTKTWRFAEQQYDCIGYDNSSISESYNGWIDLFGWGTGGEPTQTSGKFNTFTDWGTNVIGDYAANTWRTLTKDEWGYIFETRPQASNLYGFATIGETKGIVLLPDVWTAPNGITFKACTSDFTKNTFTIEQWKQLESAGAVFLPAAGQRASTNNTNASGVGKYGDYWSATAYQTGYAYRLVFNTDGMYFETCKGRFGQAVRLVQDME